MVMSYSADIPQLSGHLKLRALEPDCLIPFVRKWAYPPKIDMLSTKEKYFVKENIIY